VTSTSALTRRQVKQFVHCAFCDFARNAIVAPFRPQNVQCDFSHQQPREVWGRSWLPI
jgi:hypothetical protein